MRFERLTRSLRSTAFRLSAMSAAIFMLSYIVVFAVTYLEVGDALIQQRRAAIEQEFDAMKLRYIHGGVEALKRAIVEESTPRSGFPAFAAVLPLNGPSYGSIAILHVAPGWHDYPEVVLPSRSEEDNDEHLLAGYGGKLPDGSSLLLGFDRFNIIETQETIAWAFAWSALAMLLLAVSGGIFIGRRALSRIDVFNDRLRAYESGRLESRLPIGGSGDELDELSASVNATLGRVESLMASLRQVSNDIAHDLRTPLTRLRHRLEAASSNARTAEEYAASIGDALTQIDLILSTFSALLRIAQIEAGARRKGFTNVDLSDLCSSIVDAYRASFEDERRPLQAAIAQSVFVRGDRDLLTQALANLIENVLRHTAAGTPMKISLSAGAEFATLAVSDEGPGIPGEEREAVFRRFYRLERSRTTTGSGLGLSLVKAIAELHSGRIFFEDEPAGFRVSLQIPLIGRNKTDVPTTYID